jgi:hypothetical protein
MLFVVVSLGVSPAQSSSSDNDAEVPRYSPELDLLSRQLAANRTVNFALAGAEYITTVAGFNAATSQTIITNDRTHLLARGR